MKLISLVQQYFGFKENKTTYGTETIAGITTFLSMAYILFVNPAVLGAAHMDKGAVFTATALTTAFGTLLLGLLAKYPIAAAPGMGINAFFTYSVVIGLGVPWQTALAAVLVAGLLFFLITLFKIREIIINGIPESLKHAMAGGIGLLIAFIGLKDAHIIVDNKDTLVALGNLSKPDVLLAVFGIVVTIIFLVRGIKGGIFWGMAITAIVGVAAGVLPKPDHIVSSIPSLSPTFGQAIFHLSDIHTQQLVLVVLTFLFVSFFDTAGTILAVAHQAGFIKNNKLPRAGRSLFSVAGASIAGGILGTSPPSAYIESSSGVAAGGRTGFTSVIVAVLFLASLFFSPLLVVVQSAVTTPALVVVGILMASSLGEIDWKRIELAVPSFVLMIAIPLTYSITTGIALGFILYPITMLVKGKPKEVHPIMYILAVLFLIFIPFL